MKCPYYNEDCPKCCPHPKTITNECEHEYKVIINGQKAVIPQCLKCSKMGKRIDLVYDKPIANEENKGVEMKEEK